MKRGTKRLKAGRKSKEWIAVRRRLSVKFAALGITSCEVRISEHCTRDRMLSWAHGKKRRLLQGDELETLVCLCCQSCHQILDERMSHEDMLATVQNVIANRR